MSASIETDDTDARRILNAEALKAAGEQIRQHHAALQHIRDDVLDQIHAVCSKAFDLAKLVEQVHATLGGRRFVDWWREIGMPPGAGERYLKLARTEGRNTLGDKDQLRLIGILPEAEHGDQQNCRDANPLAWSKHVGKLSSLLTIEAVERMSAIERETAMAKLEEIMARLKG